MEYSIQLNAVNNPDKSVRAFATLVFGDSFKVTNVAVIEGSKGNFVSMPSFRTKERDGYNNPVYKDVCNPITKEFREELYSDILKLSSSWFFSISSQKPLSFAARESNSLSKHLIP